MRCWLVYPMFHGVGLTIPVKTSSRQRHTKALETDEGHSARFAHVEGGNIMNKLSTVCGFLAALMLLSGCGNRKDEFALPPGDAERGREAFVSLGCNSCHYVADGVQRLQNGANPQIYVQLGGQVTRVKSYEGLVTSIINPSHKLSRGPDSRHVNEDGESKMPRYNEVMTVQQLIDITTYLSSKYSVWSPNYRLPAS